jgi:DNA replication protein DnaC
MTAATPQTTDLDPSRSLLEDLGFEFVPGRLPELLERSVREKHSLGRFLELVARTERDAREERRVKTSLRLSGLPVGKTLDTYDFTFQRMLDRGKVELLATCEFVRRKENVLFLGPPGVGKTHLATALAVKAIQNGFSATCMSADSLVDALRKDEAVSSRRFLRRKYMTAALLIIDELGFQALDRRDAHLLFKVINSRYERASTVITSNKSIRDWPDMLAGDEVLTAAILDRLLHHCHLVQIDGRSFRLKELQAQLKKE